MRESLHKLYQWEENDITDEAHIISTSLSLLAAVGLSILLLETTANAFIKVLSIAGGVCGSIIVFILPGLIAAVTFSGEDSDNNSSSDADSSKKSKNSNRVNFYAGSFLVVFGNKIV